MEFCPKCGRRLVHKFRRRGPLYCPKCGYESRLSAGNVLRDKLGVAKPFNSSIAILDRKPLELRTIPTVNARCQKCGGGRAETWNVTVGSVGISDIILYRCVSCGYTWREIN